METDVDAGCGPGAGGDSAGLLAELRTWLGRERGLSAESVRCCCSQVKSFVAAIGGPGRVSGLDAGMVTAFMVEHAKDRNSWSAEAMVTSLRAFPVRARDREDSGPAGRRGPGGRVMAAVGTAAVCNPCIYYMTG